MGHYMKNRPLECVQKDLLRELLEYVEWHGGKNPCFVNFVCDEEGDTVALIRFNEDGKKVSGFYSFLQMFTEENRTKWDISELWVFPRGDEDKNVRWQEGESVKAMESRCEQEE